MTRDELVADLREAEGGSRILDFWCWWYGMSTEAAKPDPQPPDDDCVRDAMGSHAFPGCSPTSSLDWALRMLPPDCQWTIERNLCWVRRLTAKDVATYQGHGATTPIAICIAALRARGARG